MNLRRMLAAVENCDHRIRDVLATRDINPSPIPEDECTEDDVRLLNHALSRTEWMLHNDATPQQMMLWLGEVHGILRATGFVSTRWLDDCGMGTTRYERIPS